MTPGRCVCGCGKRGRQRHHLVYAQHVKRQAPRGLVRLSTGWVPAPPVMPPPGETVLGMPRRSLQQLLKDSRNLADIAPECHYSHHAGSRRLRARHLPDSVFEFAVELFDGSSGAYVYLARYYAGPCERLEALIGRETPAQLHPPG